ncbi:MAG: IspD/TarI family cytidylyltransferase [Erysipelotrichales bacterium]
MKLDVIILAAGQGSRMNLGYNKMFHFIDDITIIEKSIRAFSSNNNINNIIITYNEGELDSIKEICDEYKPIYVEGGLERYLSVINALKYVESEYVLIHDGARCYINNEQINDISHASIKYGAACLGVLSKDTIHICDNDNNIIETTNRSNTYIAQTPQGFKTSLIKDAYQQVLKNNDSIITDDVMVFNKYSNNKVKMVLSDYNNIKVTTKDDL